MSNGQIQIPFPYIKLPPSHIKALVQKIRSNITLTTHKKKFTKYDNSFVGNQLVSYLLTSKAVPSRRDAVEICNRLFEARLIVHVKNNQLFKDDKELYHLIDPVAGSDLVPIEIDVSRARLLIHHKGLPKHEYAYKQLIKTLQTKGVRLPEISRAICLEKYNINDNGTFPKTKINKISPQTHRRTAPIGFKRKDVTQSQLIQLNKKIIGILKYAFLAADQTRSNDLDLKEFEYLLDRLGIKVSHKGSELLFRAMLAQHNKRFLGYYEFKMAFMVTDPLQFISTPHDVHPARVLRRHIRYYYETVAQAHKANRKKLAEIAWGLFSNDKARNATMHLSAFKEGINYLGLKCLSDNEVAHIFGTMNKSETGLLKKDEFAKSVKKVIPVSLGKVVNVKEILFDAFEHILTQYQGTKTVFPKRQRSKSIVNRSSSTGTVNDKYSISLQSSEIKSNNIGKKKSLFQRMRFQSKRKKTFKAPVKSPFGSNLAEMAESTNNMMDDVILSMLTEDDGSKIKGDQNDIISAEEFRQLFSHPFFPKSTEEKKNENKNKKPVKPVNIRELSMLSSVRDGIIDESLRTFVPPKRRMDTLQTDTTPTFAHKESSYYSSDNSEIYGDVYRDEHEANGRSIAGNIDTYDDKKEYVFEEEEKQLTRKRKEDEESLLDLQNNKHLEKAIKLKNMLFIDKNGSYSPPPPTQLSTDVGISPPWTAQDRGDIVDDNEFPPPNTQYTTHHTTHTTESKSMDSAFPAPNTQYVVEPPPPPPLDRLILPDDILNESDDDIPDISPKHKPRNATHSSLHLSPMLQPNVAPPSTSLSPIQTAVHHSEMSAISAAFSVNTRLSHQSPSTTYDPPLQAMEEYRKQHQEHKKLEMDEEDGLSYYDETGSLPRYKYKEGRDSEFVKYIGELHDIDEVSDTDDSLRQLQVQYQRESQLKGDLQLALFNDTNIDDHDDIHPKDIEYDTPDLCDTDDDIQIDTKKSLKPSVAKKLSHENTPNITPIVKDCKYDELFNAVSATINLDNINHEQSIPYSTPSQFIAMKPAESIQNEKSQVLETTDDDDDDDPGAAGTADMSIDSSDTYWPWDEKDKSRESENDNPPPITVDDMERLLRLLSPPKVKHKHTLFMNLAPIPGVITLKSVKCSNLARGKMKATETYYLRVYQGECVNVESTLRATKISKTLPNMSHSDKIKEIKAKKFELPQNKRGGLPTLCVIKSYPVFAKSSQCVFWKNLPASITKDAKTLMVGIYMKRQRELVLIGKALLAKTKKNILNKIGVKNTSLTLPLNVPDKFSIWKTKSTMEIRYSFCPRQFNADIGILQSKKLPMYPAKIPIVIHLMRLHLLKVTQDVMITMDSDSDSSDSIDGAYNEDHNDNNNNNNNDDRFYNKKCPTKNLINHLVGDLNSGHFKFDGRAPEVVWYALLRWFREIPNTLLNIDIEFINDHNKLNDDDFMSKLIELLSEPYFSILVWSIDFIIDLSIWYKESLSIDNKMIDYFVPNYFGFDIGQKTKLFLMAPNAYDFILRIIDLRKKLQFKFLI